jgi:DNA-binding SARP family transcriptional activator
VSDRLEFRILGPLEVLRSGAPVTIGSGMQHTLLALLVLSANEVVPSDRLIDELWGGHPPESGATALHGLVSQLRKALEPGRPAGESGSVLVTRAPGYELVVAPEAVDAIRFERLVQSGRAATATGDPAGGRRELQAALALWRGGALADAGDAPTVHTEAIRLGELRLDALEARVDADLALGLHAELVHELEALVQREPLRERLCAQLMLALYRSGRQAEALDVYRRTRETLVGELGLEPTPGLRELEQRILQHDPGLAAPPSPGPPWRRRPGRARVLGALAVGGGAAVLAAAAAVWLFEREPAPLIAPPDSIAVVDPDEGRVVDVIAVGADPTSVAFGAGSVWAASGVDGTVTRIDPSARRVMQVIGVGRPCVHLAVGRGAVWVANGSAGSVTKIDAPSGIVAATIDLSSGPDPLVQEAVHAVAVGEGGVWAAVGQNLLVRLDPETGDVTARHVLGSAPVSVTAGLGSLWAGLVTERVVRVDPESGRVTARIPVLGWPLDLTVADGLLLVSANSLSAVDPETAVLAPTPRIGTSPVGAAEVPGPGAWVAEAQGGDVVELAPAGTEGGPPILVGHDPSAIAYGAGLLWVAVRAPESVSRRPAGS